ncbi:ECF RNA polymerase sigma-E factor [Rosistilla carotiformis]|uniref:ECF RNA polymerase sigma-E factor n=1 Tax=Rosistilla carotiformis TaxID=2528017 RepID=A0A518JS56_9BACT|nr:sigma-70 family RNA polymerase sigma factor [Rosistilla carotiformis]QDV68379.1 ECF RNA polymerase sigma-E factor [Rosistilla carotiformis]
MADQITSDTANELIRCAADGDRASLDRLLASYSGYLNVLSRLHLDRRIQHRVSPSDIVQETLLEAHRDFAGFRGQQIDEFTGWLRQVLVHNIAEAVETHLVAAKRSVRAEQVVGNLSASVDRSHHRLARLAADPQRSPASEADHRESLSELAAALEQLPADYRTVIVLRHLEGLPFGDVAQRMERSTGAVRMLWLRAIEQLRVAMESQA